MAFLISYQIIGGKTVKNVQLIHNNGDMDEIAQRPVGEWVSDIYVIIEKLSF